MFGGSSSPQPTNTAIFPLASPGRLERANCVAGSTGAGGPPAPRGGAPAPAPRPGPAPRPSPPLACAGAPPQFPKGLPPPAFGGGAGTVSGAMLKFGDDINTMPFTEAPFSPAISGCPANVLTGMLPAESAQRKIRFGLALYLPAFWRIHATTRPTSFAGSSQGNPPPVRPPRRCMLTPTIPFFTAQNMMLS